MRHGARALVSGVRDDDSDPVRGRAAGVHLHVRDLRADDRAAAPDRRARRAHSRSLHERGGSERQRRAADRGHDRGRLPHPRDVGRARSTRAETDPMVETFGEPLGTGACAAGARLGSGAGDRRPARPAVVGRRARRRRVRRVHRYADRLSAGRATAACASATAAAPTHAVRRVDRDLGAADGRARQLGDRTRPLARAPADAGLQRHRDGAAEPRLAGRSSARTLLEEAPAHRNARSACCSSTSIASRTSTTRSATIAATVLLRIVGERLERAIRTDDVVARMGGDEFVVLAGGSPTCRRSGAWPNASSRRSRSRSSWTDSELFVTTSIGIASFPADGGDAETLVKHADVAMYRAKDRGRNTYQFFTPALNATLHTRLSQEKSLRKALDNGEFVVYYQPQHDLVSGALIGRRSAGALESSALGTRVAGAVHPQRRAERLDRRARRLHPRERVHATSAALRKTIAPNLRAGGQPQRAAVPPATPGGEGSRLRRTHRPRSDRARARDHRIGRDERRRAHGEHHARHRRRGHEPGRR